MTFEVIIVAQRTLDLIVIAMLVDNFVLMWTHDAVVVWYVKPRFTYLWYVIGRRDWNDAYMCIAMRDCSWK